MDGRLSVTCVTGFLGSGKTTLIRRYLETDAGAGTGIIVNEFGEEGVDHALLVHATERVELIEGGCICCARRSDVAEAMHRLVQLSRTGKRFDRAILESSGLADPAPVVATLDRDPWLRAHVRLASVVSVFDAASGIATVEAHSEARRQISIADTVVVTKTDMRAAADFADIIRCIRAISPDTRIVDAQDPDFDINTVLGGKGVPALNGLTKPGMFSAGHAGDISSFTLRLHERIDWPAFTVWLSALLHAHGNRILRVKGLLNTTSSEAPLAIHGVQHIMHPPSHLSLADAVEDSFLVFVTKNIGQKEIQESLHRFMRAV